MLYTRTINVFVLSMVYGRRLESRKYRDVPDSGGKIRKKMRKPTPVLYSVRNGTGIYIIITPFMRRRSAYRERYGRNRDEGSRKFCREQSLPRSDAASGVVSLKV